MPHFLGLLLDRGVLLLDLAIQQSQHGLQLVLTPAGSVVPHLLVTVGAQGLLQLLQVALVVSESSVVLHGL